MRNNQRPDLSAPLKEMPPLKIAQKLKLVEYLANFDNGFISWQRLCTEVCGYKNSRYLYKLFTIEERHEILQTALAERRKNYARQGIILH